MRLKALQRNCSFCSVCCIHPSIPDIGKPERTPCQHLKKDGKKRCSIHKERPGICEAFHCAWILGQVGSEEDRPDKLGVMYSYRTGTRFAKILLVADEIREGALLEPRAYTLTKALGERELVLVRTSKKRRLIGPPEEMARVAPIIQEVLNAYGKGPGNDHPGVGEGESSAPAEDRPGTQADNQG